VKSARILLTRLGGGFCIGLIQLYRYAISPLLGPRCRFHPSCSVYALEAINQRGPWMGILLALRRLSKCHPWHPGGYDPVPAYHDPHSRCPSHCKSTLHG
jgi:hypothetical protein